MTNKKKSRKIDQANSNGKHVAFSDGTRPGISPFEPSVRTSTTPKPLLQTPPLKTGFLTRGQLNALILTSLGISRLFQLANAISRSDTGEATGSITPTDTCLKYLGSETCADSHIQLLLRVKFASAIQCAVLVSSVLILVLWNHEIHLQRLQAFLIGSPLLSTFFVLYYNYRADVNNDGTNTTSHVLLNGASQEAIMCVVLAVLAAPYDDSIFLTDLNTKPVATHTPRRSSLQRLCLMMLYMVSLVDIIRHIAPFFQALWYNKTSIESWNSSLLRQYFDNLDPLLSIPSLAAAASIIVQFVLVDILTNAIVYGYCWYALEYSNQRAVLCVVGALKFFEYIYQVPTLRDASSGSISPLRSEFLEVRSIMAVTMVCFSAFCWISPLFTRRKNLPSSSKSDKRD